MAILTVSNLCKSFGSNFILKDINFLIEENDKVGLIGPNGAGKSTLIKILAEKIPYDNGSINVAKNIKIGFMQHEFISKYCSTVGEALRIIFKGVMKLENRIRALEHKMSKPEVYNNDTLLKQSMEKYSILTEQFRDVGGYEVESRIRGILNGLGFDDEDTLISTLSGGQKTRLALARLLLTSPDILLLDEPTNYLDIYALDWLESFLKDFPKAVIVASHDRYFLDNVVSTIFELENSKLHIYRGNYSEYLKQKRHKMKVKLKHNKLAEIEAKKLRNNIENFVSTGNHTQVESRKKMLKEILPKSIVKKPEPMKISFSNEKTSGSEVLSIEDMDFSFNDKKILHNVNLKVYRGERIGVIGPNGCGKSTLLNIIAKRLKPSKGSIIYGHNVKPVTFDQEQKDLKGQNTVLQEVWEVDSNLTMTKVRSFLAKLLFFDDDVNKTINVLSGGEKSRVALAKVILQGGNLLLLDEPTNFLDILSKEQLEDALLEYDGTIIVVSHDRYFLSKLATRIWEFTNNGIIDFPGDFNYFLEKKAQKSRESKKTFENVKTKTQIKKEKMAKRDQIEKRRKKRRLLKELEEKILHKEEELEKIEHLLCDPRVYENPEKAKIVNQNYDETIKQIESLYEKLDMI